jgi:hypothetical protein
VALEQAHAGEGQQAFGYVLIFVLLKSQSTARRQNDRSHQYSNVK